MRSIGIRNYLIVNGDVIFRISNKKLERLLAGSKNDQLKIFCGKSVRMAEIVVAIVNRRPVEVVRAAYNYLHFDEYGSLDQGRYRGDISVAIEAFSPDILGGRPEGNVLYAGQKFC